MVRNLRVAPNPTLGFDPKADGFPIDIGSADALARDELPRAALKGPASIRIMVRPGLKEADQVGHDCGRWFHDVDVTDTHSRIQRHVTDVPLHVAIRRTYLPPAASLGGLERRTECAVGGVLPALAKPLSHHGVFPAASGKERVHILRMRCGLRAHDEPRSDPYPVCA